MQIDVLTIIGARPQFIKAAVLSKALAGQNIKEAIVHTGQHFDSAMSDNFFAELDIPKPFKNLNINSLSHGAMTGRMLEEIENIILEVKPKLVLVYGDTNSTLAGALAAVKLQVPIAHVEAGLRSFNRQMPEEINRILTDRVSNILFCPSEESKSHLLNEGIAVETIHVVGDIMRDSTDFYGKKFESSNLEPMIQSYIKNPYYYMTLHRDENLRDKPRVKEFFNSLDALAKTKNIVFSVHPRTKKILSGLGVNLTNIHTIEPQGYVNNLGLIKNSLGVLTDSGGMQKESYFLGRPCITLREETEWVETVQDKANFLVGLNFEKLKTAISALPKAIDAKNVYGDGDASAKILSALKSLL